MWLSGIWEQVVGTGNTCLSSAIFLEPQSTIICRKKVSKRWLQLLFNWVFMWSHRNILSSFYRHYFVHLTEGNTKRYTENTKSLFNYLDLSANRTQKWISFPKIFFQIIHNQFSNVWITKTLSHFYMTIEFPK